MYASYMVRFVCFYLRILADEEQQIRRFKNAAAHAAAYVAAYAEGRSAPGSKEDGEGDCEENSNKNCKENSRDREDSKVESNAPQPQRTTTRRQGLVDIIKDARKLFTFTPKQKMCAIRL